MENNYQLSRIHNYINGLMSKEEMYTLEREALEDPFLQDAIDGYRMQDGVNARQLSLLQQRLATRIEEQAVGRDRRFNSWQRLAVGMAAAVMFVTVCTLLLIRYLPNSDQNTLKEVHIMPDQVFSLTVNAIEGEPQKGWDTFESFMNENYVGKYHQEQIVEISFAVKNGNPENLKIDGDITENLRQELKETLLRYKGWEGDFVKFKLDIHRLKIQ